MSGRVDSESGDRVGARSISSKRPDAEAGDRRAGARRRVRLTRAFAIEGGVQFARPTLSVRLTDDFEDAPRLTASTPRSRNTCSPARWSTTSAAHRVVRSLPPAPDIFAMFTMGTIDRNRRRVSRQLRREVVDSAADAGRFGLRLKGESRCARGVQLRRGPSRRADGRRVTRISVLAAGARGRRTRSSVRPTRRRTVRSVRRDAVMPIQPRPVHMAAEHQPRAGGARRLPELLAICGRDAIGTRTSLTK